MTINLSVLLPSAGTITTRTIAAAISTTAPRIVVIVPSFVKF
jgi:hypothetical protein